MLGILGAREIDQWLKAHLTEAPFFLPKFPALASLDDGLQVVK